MYVYKYVYMRVCVYICVYINIYMCVRAYVCVIVCVRIRIHTECLFFNLIVLYIKKYYVTVYHESLKDVTMLIIPQHKKRCERNKFL